MPTQVIAHRGASAYYPENTMASFEAAVRMGADAIELDVHMSADRRIVVIHDETLERTTNGSGYVHAHTCAELKALDAGILRPGYEKERIPLLKDVLTFAKESGVWVNVEIKAGSVNYQGMEEKLAGAVRACGMEESVLFSSFNHFALLRLREAWPQAQTAVLHVSALVEPWEYAKKLGARAMHPLYAVAMLPGWVDGCRRHGVAVNAWTVDDEAAMESLFGIGVNGLVSNRPDVALRVRAVLDGRKAK